MLKRTFFGAIVMMFILVLAGNAGPNEQIQKHFNDTALKVKDTDNPAEKREIIDESLQKMMTVLDRVKGSPLVSKEDGDGIDHYKTLLQEKQDELLGNNGFERVPDSQLNAFSMYVVQSMEQADKTITISLVTALLIVIILILIL
jgi:hypothetical protein